ncbi:MAG: Tim44 domain-containing protein [Geminicoccaceae bacterium]|nr:Tim44 domain-containing protein [Geminicoccaceae bacterium]
MSESFAYIDIIFFAMIAAFIALRLRSVLGRKTGNEQQRASRMQRSAESGADKVVPMRTPPPPPVSEDGVIADVADDTVKKGLTEIRLADPSFDLQSFVEGARSAFAMIIDAYAKGDRQTLQSLLADDVFRSFDAVIAEREENDRTMHCELAEMRTAEVVGARMEGKQARVTMRFVTDQVNVLRDAAGEVVEGDPTGHEEVVDIWTFARDTRSPDPNWLLVETRAPS